jgi:ubiquinone/menaquinone biosynthesis C-methylase UbiE
VTDADQQVRGVGRMFDLISPEYDNVGVPFFGPIAGHLVEALAPQPGERALDLGCGRGAVAVRLADAVLPGGSVTGLDLSPGMVERTREALGGRHGSVEVVVGDARDPQLPAGGFDVVASSMVLFFLPDPAAALARWTALVAPGGRLGLATFGDTDPVWDEVDDLLLPYMPPLDPRVVGPQSPFASDEGMERMLSRAGATEVRTTTHHVELDVGSAQDWRRFARSVGTRAAFERMTAEEDAEVTARAGELLEPRRGEDGRIRLGQDIRVTLGSAPR